MVIKRKLSVIFFFYFLVALLVSGTVNLMTSRLLFARQMAGTNQETQTYCNNFFYQNSLTDKQTIHVKNKRKNVLHKLYFFN